MQKSDGLFEGEGVSNCSGMKGGRLQCEGEATWSSASDGLQESGAQLKMVMGKESQTY
jgi:hypothetical protein